MRIAGSDVTDTNFLTADIVIKSYGRIDKENILLFRFNGKAYAYINRRMHMRRPLNCQQDVIFDQSRRYLRCSMHGFVFEPHTGTCLSPLCESQKLQAIKLAEQDDIISVLTKGAEIIAVYHHDMSAN